MTALSSATASWKIRSVQLDLARQMETPAFIESFIDFIADNGYNSLTLYLEGRIRTKTFPFPAAQESYTPEQMSGLVRHAETRGIEVIPAVASFGHAGHFLRHARLAHLAENRPPFLGRFGDAARTAFCPSQPGTHEFLDGYLSEIAALFPSAYFHVCCDEIWDIACCDLCRQRLAQGETQSDLFTRHILKLHTIVTGKLGKRMIMWDDMFEYYPEALPQIPRDVIMACWRYQGKADQPRAHFFHRATCDILQKYDSLGFDYLTCPAAYTIRNAESFTAYAARHHPLGALLTNWENRECFVLQDMPLIAAVGHFWSGHGGATCDEAVEQVCRKFFGIEEQNFISAMKAVCVGGLYRERRIAVDDYLVERENEPDFSRACLVEMLLSVLPGFVGKAKPRARPVLQEIILSLQSESVSRQLEELLPALFRNGMDEQREATLEKVRHQLEEIAEERTAMWREIRPGIEPCRMESLYHDYLDNLRTVPELLKRNGTLTVHFMLPDQYSSQNVRIFIRYADAADWEHVAEGVFKELRNFDCFYAKSFLIDKNRAPSALKVETSGFGGQGFTYFETASKTGHYVPQAVDNVKGNVADAENLLTDDWRWTFAGERDTVKSYFDAARAGAVHGFEIILQKKPD